VYDFGQLHKHHCCRAKLDQTDVIMGLHFRDPIILNTTIHAPRF
jgi:hypothetical protein